MTWLALFFALEIGFLPQGYIGTFHDERQPEYIVLIGAGYVDFETEVRLFKYGFIGGSTKIYVNKYNYGYTFSPETAEFDFNLGIRIAPLELGFRHYCMHPIVPWIYYTRVSPQWEGAYEEIYLRLEVSP